MAEEIKSLVDKIAGIERTDELRRALNELLEKINKVGIKTLVNDFPEMLPKMMGKIREVDIKDFKDEIPKILPMFFDGVSVLAEKNDILKADLTRAGGMKVNFKIPDVGIAINMQIADGKVRGGVGAVEGADLDIEAIWNIVSNILGGEADNVISAYMSGDVKIMGDLSKAMILMPIIESLGEEVKVK